MKRKVRKIQIFVIVAVVVTKTVYAYNTTRTRLETGGGIRAERPLWVCLKTKQKKTENSVGSEIKSYK